MYLYLLVLKGGMWTIGQSTHVSCFPTNSLHCLNNCTNVFSSAECVGEKKYLKNLYGKVQ